jgi:outer membrane immunogenic protein
LRKFILGILAAVSAVPALAADLPVKAPAKAVAFTNWAGLYVGISGGGDWGRFSQTNTISGVSLGYFNQTGGLIGGTVGYNWQAGNFVYGLETDLSWSNLTGTQSCGPTLTFICNTDMRAYGTVRARAGMTVLSNTIAYVTGGLAYADIRATRNVNATVSDNWKAGYTIGGGIETMLWPQWSVKIEYLYSDFPGTATTYLVTTTSTPVATDERNVHIVRAGVNYHF